MTESSVVGLYLWSDPNNTVHTPGSTALRRIIDENIEPLLRKKESRFLKGRQFIFLLKLQPSRHTHVTASAAQPRPQTVCCHAEKCTLLLRGGMCNFLFTPPSKTDKNFIVRQVPQRFTLYELHRSTPTIQTHFKKHVDPTTHPRLVQRLDSAQ